MHVEFLDARLKKSCEDEANRQRLVMPPTKQPLPARPDGGRDWAAIDTVIVLEALNNPD